MYRQSRKDYDATPDMVLALATEPLGPLPEGAEAESFAAWTVMGNVLLNLDEFLARP